MIKKLLILMLVAISFEIAGAVDHNFYYLINALGCVWAALILSLFMGMRDKTKN